MIKISEYIKELERIKEEHGDLPVKSWEYDSLYEEYYFDEVGYPRYYKPDEDDKIRLSGEEECVIVGE